MLAGRKRRQRRAIAGVNVIAVIADEWIVTPRDVAIVEKHILPLSSVVLAIHHLHVRFWRSRIGALPTVKAVVAVRGDCILRGRGWRMPERPFFWIVDGIGFVWICKAVAQRRAVWFF